MIEVDILLIKQIELKYLSKIKKLLYLLAVDARCPERQPAGHGDSNSRATVMNYIKYLADRLINMVYPKGRNFPRTIQTDDAQHQLMYPFIR